MKGLEESMKTLDDLAAGLGTKVIQVTAGEGIFTSVRVTISGAVGDVPVEAAFSARMAKSGIEDGSAVINRNKTINENIDSISSFIEELHLAMMLASFFPACSVLVENGWEMFDPGFEPYVDSQYSFVHAPRHFNDIYILVKNIDGILFKIAVSTRQIVFYVDDDPIHFTTFNSRDIDVYEWRAFVTGMATDMIATMEGWRERHEETGASFEFALRRLRGEGDPGELSPVRSKHEEEKRDRDEQNAGFRALLAKGLLDDWDHAKNEENDVYVKMIHGCEITIEHRDDGSGYGLKYKNTNPGATGTVASLTGIGRGSTPINDRIIRFVIGLNDAMSTTAVLDLYEKIAR